MGHDGLVVGFVECVECCADGYLDGRVVDEGGQG